MLKTEIASTLLDCELLTQVILQHQGGRWEWGTSLKQRIERHPKARILEFPDKIELAASFNRTLEHVVTADRRTAINNRAGAALNSILRQCLL
jgi:hypothetical protein